MKKFISQLTIGLIFLLFGFMITSQMNMLNKQVASAENKQSPEILVENEQLKKQRDELKKKIDELTKKTEEFESAAAGRTDEANLILQELQETRLRAGLSDVKGEGITIYITPKANLFGNTIDNQPIIDLDLLNIVNELNAASAEAISINDIRLMGRSGIRTAGNSIIINNERISPQKRVTIKAIGSKKNLEGAMNFPGTIPERLTNSCEVVIETNDNIVIKKGQNTLKYEYAKQVSE
ncbi:DUF881 domain-containing protein [Clostridium sp.]|uniref:DUF881 domain-containing protein n=1 Tax=Clostridium sp. TaxID=1506 RepID=UPI002FCA6441